MGSPLTKDERNQGNEREANCQRRKRTKDVGIAKSGLPPPVAASLTHSISPPARPCPLAPLLPRRACPTVCLRVSQGFSLGGFTCQPGQRPLDPHPSASRRQTQQHRSHTATPTPTNERRPYRRRRQTDRQTDNEQGTDPDGRRRRHPTSTPPRQHRTTRCVATRPRPPSLAAQPPSRAPCLRPRAVPVHCVAPPPAPEPETQTQTQTAPAYAHTLTHVSSSISVVRTIEPTAPTLPHPRSAAYASRVDAQDDGRRRT